MGDYNYDEEDEEDVLPLVGVEKAAALQQCRVFNEVPLKKGASINAITQILYLMSTGTKLTVAEAKDLFFMSTKLLQSSHPKLRRLHYILMKELSPLVEESFIASNSLMNDIKSNNDSAKSNAIRALFSVMDSTMYNSIDRTITENMTSHNPNVVTSALVTGIHMSHTNPDMPKKWSTQLTEVMKGRTKAQYPCIALLHAIRKNDRLSASRLIEQATTNQIRSPLALCLIIKMCTELMQEDFGGSLDIYKFVTSMMHHNSDLVVFEATKSICSLRNITDKEVTPAVLVLQLYLTSQNPVLRFAAISQINHIATVHPTAVAPINSGIEGLVSDSNRIVATLAITSLLKTGTETTIERLIAQLSGAGYLNELGDEFKMVIVDAMRVLNVKFPQKYGVLLSFLFKALSEEGSSQLKQNVVDTMIEIAKSNPESDDIVLTHLAEFIDDCEFPLITKRVLMYFGEEVPGCSNPKKFVRYVYNHATLESAEVRAVAISTLAKLAARVPTLRRSIVMLLKRSCADTDDEVRDRAALYTKLFLMGDEVLIQTLIDNVAVAVAAQRAAKQAVNKSSILTSVELAQQQQQQQQAGGMDGAAAAGRRPVQGSAEHNSRPGAISQVTLQGRDELRRIKQLRELGEPVRSSDLIALTEADNEYVVSVMKHAYASTLVLQFRVKNTMEGVNLHNITILLDTEELSDVVPLYAIPIDTLAPGSTKYAYVVLEYQPHEFPSGTVGCTFRFAMADEGATTELTDEEEYPIEEFDVDVKDFINPIDLGPSIEEKWTSEESNETAGTFSLSSMRNLTAAAHELATFFGMFIVDGVPEKIATASHTLFMSGVVADAERTVVLVQAKVFISTDNSVALHLAIRGGDQELREYLLNALLG